MNQIDIDTLAFDYVTGVLRGEERKQFEAIMIGREDARERVHFWEEELIALSDARDERAPDANVWPAIEKRIRSLKNLHPDGPTSTMPWKKWFTWSAAGLIASVISLCLVVMLTHKEISAARTNYVAVLTTDKGNAVLTALTAMTGQTLLLKWETINIPADKNLQLWVISRRDGQIRSLAVFNKTENKSVTLSATDMHLIRDAESLLLTEEEIGGSPMDEPSENIIAKGVCVFLDSVSNTL